MGVLAFSTKRLIMILSIPSILSPFSINIFV
jgi:hypothetical protein